MGEQTAIVEVGVDGITASACPHAIGIISEIPGLARFGHAGKLSALLPVIGPCSVIQGVADGIVGDVRR